MSGTTSPIYNHSFLSETLSLTQEFLSDIVASINDLGEFSHEKELFWNQHITKLSLDISQFVELTTLLSKTAMARKNQSIPEIKESHIQMLFIMKAIIQSQLKQDYVALEELIKYELKDNLTQWKIDLIPQIRKLLNS